MSAATRKAMNARLDKLDDDMVIAMNIGLRRNDGFMMLCSETAFVLSCMACQERDPRKSNQLLAEAEAHVALGLGGAK